MARESDKKQVQSAAAKVPVFLGHLPPGKVKGSHLAAHHFWQSLMRRRKIQRPLRTLRMSPAGWHSPAEWLRVMLGQLWALPGRRASGDLPLMTFPPRASNLTLSLSVNPVLLTVNSFVRFAPNCFKRANARRCVPLSLPVPEWARVKR